MDDLDDWFENFGKIGKPGDPHLVADCFEAMTIVERARGEFDRAFAFQEIADRLRQRQSDPYRAIRGLPFTPPSDESSA